MLYIFEVFFFLKNCTLCESGVSLLVFFSMKMVSFEIRFEIENTRNTTQAGPFLSHCLYTTNIDYECNRIKKTTDMKD